MIQRVVIRRFKRFQESEFKFPEHVVIAGPNNTGKTTVLQAIAAWSLALKQWRTLNDFMRHGGGYTKKPIGRGDFTSVPLRQFDLLWKDREYWGSMEVEVHHRDGWSITMEFIKDSTEQIHVRPKKGDRNAIMSATLDVVFVPPMTGIAREEPRYANQTTIDALLGTGKPGDILRNLLVEAFQDEAAWRDLTLAINKLFGFTILSPESTGAFIRAEYQMNADGPAYDIASAGSGFLQVLLLLTYLHTRRGSVLLLDEPDAHLHILLQEAIWSILKEVARKKNSQLIIATHSEIIINSIEPRNLCVLLDQPRIITTEQERRIVASAVRILENTEIMLAQGAVGILYLEGVTDLRILTEWARILGHPLYDMFRTNALMWRPIVVEQRLQGTGIKSIDHHRALKLLREDFPAVELVDGDARNRMTADEQVQEGNYYRLRWRRYEIESYLVHAGALERFVHKEVGEEAQTHLDDMREYLRANLPPNVITDPQADHEYLNAVKARTSILPQVLGAAGLPGFDYHRYYEIAECMLPDEIHPEIVMKLNRIVEVCHR